MTTAYNTNENETYMKVYTEVSILPCHSGFGMYQSGELHISPQTSWSDERDLYFEIATNSENAASLAEALENPEFVELGIEDIAGRIHNQPSKIYARINDGQLSYFGIVETEVAESFYE